MANRAAETTLQTLYPTALKLSLNLFRCTGTRVHSMLKVHVAKSNLETFHFARTKTQQPFALCNTYSLGHFELSRPNN